MRELCIAGGNILLSVIVWSNVSTQAGRETKDGLLFKHCSTHTLPLHYGSQIWFAGTTPVCVSQGFVCPDPLGVAKLIAGVMSIDEVEVDSEVGKGRCSYDFRDKTGTSVESLSDAKSMRRRTIFVRRHAQAQDMVVELYLG